MGTKIKATKVNGRWWNMPCAIHRQEGSCGICRYNTHISSMLYTFTKGLTNHLHPPFSDLAGVWEITVYSCLVFD